MIQGVIQMKQNNFSEEVKNAFISFSELILEFSTERETSLKRKDFEALLKVLVDNIPFIHSGSVLLQDVDGSFYYIAAYNHDYKLLEKIRFKKEEMFMRRFKHVYIIKRKSIDFIKELSQKVGNIDDTLKESVKSIENIKAFVSIPIRVQRKIVGFFNLDTWEDEYTFEKNNFLPFAEMISDLLSLSVERFELIKSVKELNEKINKVVMFDPVTHLPNYKVLGNYFDKYVSLAKRDSSNLYLIKIKFENIDEVDRKHGFDYGNNILQKFAKIIEKNIRRSDILVSLNRESFAVLAISKSFPYNIFDRLNDSIVKFINSQNLDLTCTIGISEYGVDGKDVDSLINSAEEKSKPVKESKSVKV